MKKIIISFCILFIGIVLFIVGCSKSSPQTVQEIPKLQQTASWADIHWLLTKDNNLQFKNYIYGDNFYTLVDEDFFVNNVLVQYNSFLIAQGMQTPSLLKNDCDKFSRGFSFFSRVKSLHCAAITNAMAVADFYYDANFDKSHAINIAIVLDNKTNQKKLLYIDPQNQTIINTASYTDFKDPMFSIKFVGF